MIGSRSVQESDRVRRGEDVVTTVLVNFAVTKRGTIVTVDPRLAVRPGCVYL
jgi:hypothetical protein